MFSSLTVFRSVWCVLCTYPAEVVLSLACFVSRNDCTMRHTIENTTPVTMGSVFARVLNIKQCSCTICEMWCIPSPAVPIHFVTTKEEKYSPILAARVLLDFPGNGVHVRREHVVPASRLEGFQHHGQGVFTRLPVCACVRA